MPLKRDMRWKIALFLSMLKIDLNQLIRSGLVVRVFGRKSESGIPYIAVIVASKDYSITTNGVDFGIDDIPVDEIVAKNEGA